MLTIENLSVNYGQSQILNDVSLKIEERQVVCLLGRNGVGKTTLLKTIMGLLRPRAGRVLYESRDVTALPTHRRAWAGIGYIPQGRGIFPYMSVQENLLMGLERTHTRSADVPDEMLLDFALHAASHYSIMEKGRIVADGPTQYMSPTTVQQYLAV